jgi:hypothetical protein
LLAGTGSQTELGWPLVSCKGRVQTHSSGVCCAASPHIPCPWFQSAPRGGSRDKHAGRRGALGPKVCSPPVREVGVPWPHVHASERADAARRHEGAAADAAAEGAQGAEGHDVIIAWWRG